MLSDFYDARTVLWCFNLQVFLSAWENFSWGRSMDGLYYHLFLKILDTKAKNLCNCNPSARDCLADKRKRGEINKFLNHCRRQWLSDSDFLSSVLTFWVSKEKPCQTNTAFCGTAARQGDYSRTFTLNERTLNAALVAIGHRERHGGLSSSTYDVSRHPACENWLLPRTAL